jgi:hypothetical protein
VDPQQPVAEAGRDGVGPPGAGRDPLQHVGEHAAVDDAEHRPAEPDVRLAQQLPCRLVVQQDPPVDRADEHGDGQLGHERREPVALLRQLGPGLRDACGDLVLAGLGAGGQFVHRLGEGPQLGRRPDVQPVRPVGRGHQPGLGGHPPQRDDVRRQQPSHDHREPADQQHRGHGEPDGLGAQHLAQEVAVGRAGPRPHADADDEQDREDVRRKPRDGE